MANIKNTSGSFFITKTLHLEGQKVFGFMKWRIDVAPRLEGDSYNMIMQIYLNQELMQHHAASMVQMLMLANPMGL
jgi:hypothetical protein